MKIVHILKGKANPHTMNGVNKVVHHLATEQQRLGVTVEVWGITGNPDIVRHQHEYPLRLFIAKKNRFVLDKTLQATIRLLPPDAIVHFHSVFLPELYAVSRKLRQKGLPWVLSPHSGYSPQGIQKNRLAKLAYMALFEKWLINGARKLHAIGESEMRDLQRFASEKSVVLVPNGQDFESIRFQPIDVVPPQARPLFGFCGRLAKEHKGLDLLIEGFAHYKQKDGSGELWLVGDGPDKDDLEALVRSKGLSKSVYFLGPMFGEQKLAHLSQFDIFVHTSRWEGMPMAVLEAAALGKPVLISKETNMGDFVMKYENGIVLSKNTTEEITGALWKFEEMSQRFGLKTLGTKSVELIEKEFGWENIARRMVNELYDIGC